MITLDKVSATINDNILFTDLSLTLLPGGIFQIIGKDSLAQTGLLEIISSLSKPTKGKILVNELDIYQQINEYRDALNYISLEDNLINNRTVNENIAFWAKLSECELLVDAALTHFGLVDLAKQKCKNLNKLQKQLLKLSRLLASPSEIWLLDNPFAELDEEHKTQLKNLMILRARDNGIILFTAQEQINIPNLNYINLNDFNA